MTAEGGSAPLTLADLLEGVETRSEPFDLHEVAEAVRALGKQLQASGKAVTLDIQAEWLAFTLMENYRGDDGFAWGTYYGPVGVFHDAQGKRVEMPPPRRFRILNGLFLGLQRCGCAPWIREREKRELGVEVGDQNVGFALETIGRPSASVRPANAKNPKLRLTITEWDRSTWSPRPGKSWADSESTSLEEQITEITVELIVAGEAGYRDGVVAHRQWLLERWAELEEEERRRKEEEARKERERLAKLEQENIDRLVTAATNWRRAHDLRAFVNAVRSTNTTPTDAFERWVAWALEVADRIDPLLTGQLRLDGTEASR